MTEPDTYDRFVDWRARIERESPFFRSRFARHGVRTVLDVGCGTGMLPIHWATWGLSVMGVDPDEGMLAQAMRNAEAEAGAIAAAAGSIRFERAGFGELVALGAGPVDAVTCTGNALPHIAGREALAPTLADFAAVLRPGGLLVLHLLNHDRLLETRLRAIPPVVRDAEDGTTVFLRLMDYSEDGILLDFVTLHRAVEVAEGAEPWDVSSHSSRHTALPSAVLRAGLAEAGFEGVEMFGSHAGAVLRSGEDESVIVTAVRTA
jgi:SAM-dependent methyltransferase